MRDRLVRPVLLASVPFVVLAVGAVAGIACADWLESPPQARTPVAQLVWVLDRGDRLHYVGHLALGRLLDLCPCTRAVADDQYRRALPHARTPRQSALVGDVRPRGLNARLVDAVDVAASGVRWGRRGAAWVSTHLTARFGPRTIDEMI
jgi:hypothetical protein